MAHDHAGDRGRAEHDHGPGHSHAGPGTDRWRIATALGITAALFVVQLVGALWTGSLALLIDTAHVLTDAGGLLLALIAAAGLISSTSCRVVTLCGMVTSAPRRLVRVKSDRNSSG